MKVGIVGTGVIAQEILPLLRNWGWEPIALCGTPNSEAVVKKLCDAQHVSTSYVDYSAMLSNTDIDTVYIAVPNFLHYSFTKQALEVGRNVIVEKPLTSNDHEAEELSNIAREKP